jgi:acetolactate synthase-1/2/3 large subunit
MPTYADVVAATLAEAGIEYVLGVPGSLSSVELIEAAAKRGVRYVLTSNESSAAVMAGVYGTLRNRPGVLSTGVGPGAVAAVAGVTHCYLERVPALVLTDRYGDAEYARLSRQRVDQPAVFRAITKASYTLTRENAAATIREGISMAMSGRQGPVHVDLPYDVMLAEAPESAFDVPTGVSDAQVRVDDVALQRALDAINGARRPVLIAGLQVNRAGSAAEDAFVRLAERLNAPVFASLAAKGTLPEGHALAAGTFRGVAAESVLIDKADLIVLAGFDPVEIFTPGIWRYDAPVICIDELPVTDAPYRPAIEAIGPLAPSLDYLAERVTPSTGWDREAIDAYRDARRQPVPQNGAALPPAAVVRLARDHLPDDGIVTVDAGQHKVLVSDMWETRRRRGFLTSSGLGSMAVALPAAIAAKLLEPSAPVLALMGDGGFLMRVGDLETAVREQLPIVVVVFNDRTLNLITIQQQSRGYERRGVDFADADFAAVARGFGFEAERVATEQALDEALATAFASNRPWLIDALIDPDGYG